jgi:hypothetical protein
VQSGFKPALRVVGRNLKPLTSLVQHGVGLLREKCHEQDYRQYPGKVARTTMRLGSSGAHSAPINRIFHCAILFASRPT